VILNAPNDELARGIKMILTNRWLKRFSEDANGNVAIMVGLSAIPIMFGLALSVDYGGWINQRTDLAAAADAASLAGARELADVFIDRKDGEAVERATAVATKYALANEGEQESPYVDVTTASDPMTVSVKLTASGKQYFSKAVSEQSVKVGFTSVAAAVQVANACVVALSKTADPGIEYNLQGDVIANECSIWANSETANSTNGNGSGKVVADANCSVGKADVTSGFNVNPGARSDCIPVKDPFADWDLPDIPEGPCQKNPIKGTGEQPPLTPGKYCNIKAVGQAKVTLNPGNYFIDGGTLDMVGGSELYGEGVTLIFINGANINLGGVATLNLSAPEAGPNAGMVLASGRGEPEGLSTLKGTTEFKIQGNVYMPTHEIVWTGGPEADLPAEYTTLVASKIRFNGSTVSTFRHKGGSGSDEGARAFSHVHLIK
jgi:Flp pilus assembly protein TadG